MSNLTHGKTLYLNVGLGTTSAFDLHTGLRDFTKEDVMNDSYKAAMESAEMNKAFEIDMKDDQFLYIRDRKTNKIYKIDCVTGEGTKL